MKKERGITLIALVITIIVLLILAGVSISLVMGENGVLSQARNAVVDNKNATAKEEVALAWASLESDYWSKWASNSSLKKSDVFTKENMNKYLQTTGRIDEDNSNSFIYNEGGTSTVIYTSKDNDIKYTFQISANGDVNESIGPTLISFTIGEQSYQAEEGMTWGKWCESKYCPNGFEINWLGTSEYGYCIITSWVGAGDAYVVEGIYSNDEEVVKNTLINKNTAYVITRIN